MMFMDCWRIHAVPCICNDSRLSLMGYTHSPVPADLKMDKSSAARLIELWCIHKTVYVDGVGKAKTTSSRE